ncbi:MAG TPA: CHAT domain-containing tetratricopeptide repeat protein [Thermoanaerobaculia bacterium]|nr:CHAT domain-containing tetratricopeptide repeat protein [Thermoanaerobaculia bacterium]
MHKRNALAPDAERAIELANVWKLDEAEREARAAFVDSLACADVIAKARALEAIGIVARLRGNTDEALSATLESIAIAQVLDDTDTRARGLNALGRIRSDLLADPEGAREDHERVLTLPVRDRRIAARALNNLGNLAVAEHDLVTARGFYDRAVEESVRAKDDIGLLAATHNAGLVLSLSGEAREALTHFARAEQLDRRMGGAQRARILLSQSEAQRALGNTAAALALLRSARNVRGDAVTNAIVSIREADVHLEQARLAKAEDALRDARRIAQKLNDSSLIALELAYRAKLRLAQQRFAEAAELAMRSARNARELGALDVAAQASSIAGTAYRKRGHRKSAKTAFRAAIDAVEQQRQRVSSSPETRQRFFEGETYPYTAMLELSIEDGDAEGALEYAESAKARVLRDLSRATVRVPSAIEFAVTDTATYAFTIANGRVSVTTIPIRRQELDELTARFGRDLALRNLAFRMTARRLYDLLLGQLTLSGSRLLIVPDGPLWRVPFHALVDPNDRYVIERFDVAYAPSIYGTPANAKPAGNVVLTSAIDEAAREIAEIRAIWGNAKVIPAIEERVRAAATRASIVHIAAHGVYDESDPMQSHLVLDDGNLTARELMRLRLPSSLVILSACEMGVGRPAAGEGLVGMSWALLLAGASAIVAGTWDVDSESTARLMVAFHRHLAAGATPASALRRAQLGFLAEAHAHPFYWAGFALIE